MRSLNCASLKGSGPRAAGGLYLAPFLPPKGLPYWVQWPWLTILFVTRYFAIFLRTIGSVLRALMHASNVSIGSDSSVDVTGGAFSTATPRLAAYSAIGISIGRGARALSEPRTF